MPEPEPVPHQLHFVWFGREPSEVALRNLEAWSAKAAAANAGLPQDRHWTVNLWTDPDTWPAPWRQGVLDRLAQHGVNVRRETTATVTEQSGPGLTEIMSTGLRHGAFNLGSDIARYAVLGRHGGIYADVDLAPGTVSLNDLSGIAMSRDDLSVFGPALRDEIVVNRVLEHDIDAPITPADLHQAAGRRYDAGDLANHFIVAPPGSSFFTLMNEVIPRTYARYIDNANRAGTGDRALAELSAVAADISGPNLFFNSSLLREGSILELHARQKLSRDSLAKTEVRGLMNPAVLQGIAGLTWVTDESAAQLDRVQGSLRRLVSPTPDVPHLWQNQDVIDANRATLSVRGPGEQASLTDDLARVLTAFEDKVCSTGSGRTRPR